jgi:ATP-binding cassette, subfamily B, bacterial
MPALRPAGGIAVQLLLDVAAAVELEAFETSAFHNRLQRVRMNMHQPLNLVFGLSGIVGAAVGVVGVTIALVTIEPLRTCRSVSGSG